jgi:hypothetical protein
MTEETTTRAEQTPPPRTGLAVTASPPICSGPARPTASSGTLLEQLPGLRLAVPSTRSSGVARA